MEFKDVRDLAYRDKGYKEFQKLAEIMMGKHFGVPLTERRIPGVPKLFDLVSPDHMIVGDAKYLSLVNGVSPPPAKLMEITGHVWQLEQTKAGIRFLVLATSARCQSCGSKNTAISNGWLISTFWTQTVPLCI
jgi:hypothetical protein